jgi:hypothetical protein
MGRASDYINSLREGKRPSRAYGGPSQSNGIVEVTGAEQMEQIFNQLLSTDPTMDRFVKKLIRQVLREARNRVSKDIHTRLTSDPRKAYKAVKYMAYKKLFGGNISILQKAAGRAGAPTTYARPHTLRQGQRGGNRIPRATDSRNRLDKYEGSDRGFALRFVNSGTVKRLSRHGARGQITGNNMFGRIAPWHMQQAVEEASAAVAEYITQLANG